MTIRLKGQRSRNKIESKATREEDSAFIFENTTLKITIVFKNQYLKQPTQI